MPVRFFTNKNIYGSVTIAWDWTAISSGEALLIRAFGPLCGRRRDDAGKSTTIYEPLASVSAIEYVHQVA